ncbi:Rieske (2Fe-2S) protein [Azonexus sp. IMCC34842]|uniref:Rieske (2Fe-2S) protein n=1 Tax=Azonexus sp. IMCC34842 TaxID=3420950 RepID=UPI003D1446F7
MNDSIRVPWFELPNAPATGTRLCALDDVPEVGVKMLVIEAESDKEGDARQAPFRLVILRSASGIKAYVNRCAHFGVPLSEKPEHLIFTPEVSISCNVHYARYRWSDGHCLEGECKGEALIAVPVAIDAAGQIIVAA